ncbi:hypothetical protein JHW43_002729 [Diplocarpon mali]|nr:hypothetical protein JHW43_002729 [Diplocarpon mali]
MFSRFLVQEKMRTHQFTSSTTVPNARHSRPIKPALSNQTAVPRDQEDLGMSSKRSSSRALPSLSARVAPYPEGPQGRCRAPADRVGSAVSPQSRDANSPETEDAVATGSTDKMARE